MEDETKKCSICGKLHNKEDIDSFRINQWDGFCHSSEGIYICKDCFEETIKMTEKGMFLTYNGYLYHYRPDCFVRINSKHDIDRIFNKDYYDILNTFEEQNENRERKHNW
jgi:hypothetical protein